MKNRRDVCHAKNAGFISFDGLDGSVKTGCTVTPSFKSRFCSNHVNHACSVTQTERKNSELENDECDEVQVPSSDQNFKDIAEMLLAKKETRTKTYYQVMCSERVQ